MDLGTPTYDENPSKVSLEQFMKRKILLVLQQNVFSLDVFFI